MVIKKPPETSNCLNFANQNGPDPYLKSIKNISKMLIDIEYQLETMKKIKMTLFFLAPACVDFHETCPVIAENKRCHHRLAILSMCPYSCCMCRSCPEDTQQDQENPARVDENEGQGGMIANNSLELESVSTRLDNSADKNIDLVDDNRESYRNNEPLADSIENGNYRDELHTHNGRSSATADAQICEDQDGRCTEWATRGDCQSNRETLLITCPRSCGTCRGNLSPGVESEDDLYDPTTCRDRSDDCASHAEYNSCQTYLMVVSCPKTCNFCAPRRQPCQNKHHLCPTWTFQNHCKINPVFMVLNCRLSCGFCF